LKFWKLLLAGLLIVCCLERSVIAQDSDQPEDPAPGINSGLLSSFRFRELGPALMSGRIIDIAVDPTDRGTWYVAAASGGVWKTVNGGTTWNPIFDRYGSYSIGCVAIDPTNPHVIWVGTGENNSQRSVGYGDGIYKSLDGGKSFQKMGLESSEHIAKIVFDPNDGDCVYVAAQGPLWNGGGDRGLYKTTDGGKSWARVLEISPDTGVTDVIIDPREPQRLYAASYQRRRHVWTLIDGGPESAIHKSDDGGATWRKITSGLPGGDLGRIGLEISPQNPDVLYAIVEATGDRSGFYRSSDRGETWDRQSDYVTSSPQYYQELVADPHTMDKIYALDTYLMVSDDGGRNFRSAGESDKHVDNHALVIDPQDPDHLIVGCDGGIYETWDGCKNYRYTANLPLTQFYKIAVDDSKPFYFVYGGTQDNATQGGPSRTDNVHGVRNSDWFITVFGDGFGPAVDQEDPNIVYSQWQYGGLVRFDRRTGERMDIKPREAVDGPPLRWNWDTALALSPHQPGRLYYGAQILFRSDDRGDSWTAISPDLTRNLDRNSLKVMGKVWSVDSVAKNTSTSFYGTIVAAAESPVQANLLYVGTDDGLIQISEDGGENWTKVETFSRLEIPEFAYVSDIEPSRHDADTVYVVLQNFKRGDFKPYIVKSSDRGKTWIDITGDLPERGSTYTICEDHVRPELLFAGTEFGAFATLDGGLKWNQLRGGLPTIAVRDMQIQRRENDLVLGTFGRGIYILDDFSPLREITSESLETEAEIYPIKAAPMFLPRAPMSGSGRAYQGAGFYTADNPPFGATFTYRVKESLTTKKSERQKKEAKAGARGDSPYPSWDELKAEDREESPAILLIVRDSEGNEVRTLRGSTSSGIHRVTWDFRYPSLTSSRRGRGPMVLPGTYTVELAKWIDGVTTQLAEAESFECIPLGLAELTEQQRAESLAFQQQTAEMQSVLLAAYQVLQEAMARVGEIKSVAEDSSLVPLEFRNRARELEIGLMDLRERFAGDPTTERRSEPAMPGLIDRVQTIVGGHWSTSQTPTETHRKLYEMVSEAMGPLLADLRKAVEKDLVRMEAELDKMSAPWTPGRKIPNWPTK
jgi:photosystem II stability/assembly factor-like uncharacterized protein